jgi:glycosyltransferase involved in cell wall biosynthesis
MKTPDSNTSPKPIRVAFFHRKPRALGNFSIETYFQQIREHLPQPFQPVYVEMPYESNGLWRRLANAMYCFFKQEDINHVTGDINYVSILLRKNQTITTIHDCGPLKISKGIKLRIIQLFWLKLPVWRSKFIIANSTSTKNDIVNATQCDHSKIRIIPICINQIFQFHEKVFNSKNPKILQIGTAKNKNIELLIESLQGINCHLIIIGKVQEKIKKLSEKYEVECHYIEKKISDTEILHQYINSDIVSLISTNEGFGMPIIEANAVGRIVVTSDISSMPEVAGNAAVLCNPFDTNSIQSAFKEIISNKVLRDQLIRNGKENKERFTVEKIVSEHVNIYYKILANQT